MAVHAEAPASVEVVGVASHRIEVKGALVFATARQAREAGLKLVRNAGSREPLVVDCAGVKESDSAGLAVLIDWLAHANRQGRVVQFANLPAGIVAAARISEVEGLLGLKPAVA